MTNHACLHHNAACRAEQSGAAKGQPAAAKRRAPIGCSTPASCGLPRGVSCFLRGPQHLVDEALRLRRAGTADASMPNTQIAVAHAHGKACQRSKSHMVPKTPLIPLVKMQSAARAPTDRHARTQAMPMACGSTGEPLLSRLPNRACKVNPRLRFSATFCTSNITHSLQQQRTHLTKAATAVCILQAGSMRSFAFSTMAVACSSSGS